MARHEVNRAAACYHILTALLLLLCGGGLLALGIWLQVTSHGGPLNLEYGSNDFLDFVLRAGIVCIVVGSFLILTAVTALIALGRRCVGKTFRIIYIILAIVVFLLILFVAVVSWMVFARRNTQAVKTFFEDAWKRTVLERPNDVCLLESWFNCRSFNDVTCTRERCAECTAGPPRPSGQQRPGGQPRQLATGEKPTACYMKIRRDLRNVYLPTAIVSTVLAAIVLVDLFVVCAL